VFSSCANDITFWDFNSYKYIHKIAVTETSLQNMYVDNDNRLVSIYNNGLFKVFERGTPEENSKFNVT